MTKENDLFVSMPVGKAIAKLAIPTVIRFLIVFPAFCFILDAAFGADGLMWVQPIADTIALILAAVLFIRFKKSLARHTEKEQAEPAETLPSHRIVAISREFGSGGRTIGKEVAAQLKIPCYDSELIEKIAAQSGFAKEYVEKYGEYAVSVYGERDEKPMQRIRDKDKKRKAYYEIYTGTEWGKADNYDLCWTAAFSEWINACRRSKSCIDIFAKKR